MLSFFSLPPFLIVEASTFGARLNFGRRGLFLVPQNANSVYCLHLDGPKKKPPSLHILSLEANMFSISYL